MLVAAWNVGKMKTVTIFFRNSKILSESQKVTIAEEDDSFKELEKEIENLH